jgi:peptidyl-prolyl cis-trans isomerase-like 4
MYNLWGFIFYWLINLIVDLPTAVNFTLFILIGTVITIYGIINGESNKYFKDEIIPKFKHNKKGLIGTANIGPNMNTSTFYITLTNNPINSLNNKHTIFGIVKEGFDTLEKINNSYCDNNNRPYKNIRIKHTYILDDPFKDLDGMIIPSKSPEYKIDKNDIDHLEDNFDINNFYKDKNTEEQIKNKLQEQESKNRALILELLEDIPDVDIKPPENVLFICKLNPITQDEDLENIFERFGPIKSCQIVRDKKTGESLQYGFIEFEKVEDCERAYLKMNGVLIDDKRIKVDFSQSVSKYWVNYKKNNNNENNNKDDEKNNEGNDLTLINENVKLEIKNKNNFQFGNKDKNNNQYKYVFHRDNNEDNENKYDKKRKRKERSRDKNYHSIKQHYHSSHHHKHKH